MQLSQLLPNLLTESMYSAPITQLEFSDRDKKKTAAFSNWNEVETPVRKRVKDEATGKYYWDSENVEDGEESLDHDEGSS